MAASTRSTASAIRSSPRIWRSAVSRGFEKNLHAQDAPVSFPPIWTVPWFKYAQYDASIEQPLIRNAGEALGVTALVNLSADYPCGCAVPLVGRPEQSAFWIEDDAARPRSLRARLQSGFGGLTSPKWPSQIFGDDPAWKIDPERVTKGRKLYAEICAECHLGPVNDPKFDAQFPEQELLVAPSEHWTAGANGPGAGSGAEERAAGMGTDPAQADVLAQRTRSASPASSTCSPRATSQTGGDVATCQPTSSTDMPYSLALMVAVDLVSTEMDGTISSFSKERSSDALGATKELSQSWAEDRIIARVR